MRQTPVLDDQRKRLRAWQERVRDPSLTVLLALGAMCHFSRGAVGGAVVHGNAIAVRLGQGHGDRHLLGAGVAFEDRAVRNREHGGGHAADFERFQAETT